MRKLVPIFILFLIFAVGVIAKEPSEDKIPPGMEIIILNNVRYLVPLGTRIKDEGGALSVEGHNEYAARRFQNIGGRLKILEENEKKIRSDIRTLKEIAYRLQTGLRQQEVDSASFNEKKLRSDIIGLLKGVIDKLQIELQQQEASSGNLIEAPE